MDAKALTRNIFTVIFAVSLSAMANTAAVAHGGGLNSEGCHHNRKTGGYHCHRAPSRPAPPLATQGPIKLAPSGTCYGPNSESYADIIAVKSFQSIAACRQAGGR